MSENATPVTLPTEELVGLAFQAAGAASAVFMEAHPRDVMPTEEISRRVAHVLLEYGVDVRQVHGYGGVVDAQNQEDRRA